MDVEKRLEILEKNFSSLLNALNNQQGYDIANFNGMMIVENNNTNGISQNSADIDFIAMETGVDLEG